MAVGPARIHAQSASLRSIEIDLANNVDILDARQTLFRTDAGSRRLLTDQRALVARRRAGLGRGEFFGERALITGEPRSATVRATSDGLACAPDKASFEAAPNATSTLRDPIFSVYFRRQ